MRLQRDLVRKQPLQNKAALSPTVIYGGLPKTIKYSTTPMEILSKVSISTVPTIICEMKLSSIGV